MVTDTETLVAVETAVDMDVETETIVDVAVTVKGVF